MLDLDTMITQIDKNDLCMRDYNRCLDLLDELGLLAMINEVNTLSSPLIKYTMVHEYHSMHTESFTESFTVLRVVLGVLKCGYLLSK